MEPANVLALAALVKASQPIAAPFAKKGATLLGKLLGPGATALGDRIGEFLSPPAPAQPTVLDTIAIWRHGNMTLVLGRTAEVLEELRVEPRPLPIGVLLPLLEAASLVDDPDLREMWARLLASGVAADEHQHPIFINLLRQMNAADAIAFREVCAGADEHGVPVGDVKSQRALRTQETPPTHARLEALGLIIVGAVDPRLATIAYDAPIYDALTVPTRLGVQFRRAVTEPNDNAA